MTPLEKVIRPIVEGQIRGFLKEHPGIIAAVDWYKPRDDKAQTLINSLSKRIVRDLTCGTSAARLAAALLEPTTEALSSTDRGRSTAAVPARLAPLLSEPEPYRLRRRRVMRAPELVA